MRDPDHALAVSGIPFAPTRRVLGKLTVSGVECVEALCMAGFRVRQRGAGETTLERGTRSLVVPDRLVLSQELLDAILEEADLSAERFVWLLGEVTTETEIQCDP